MSDTDQTTPVGPSTSETETARQGKGAPGAPPNVAADEEPAGTRQGKGAPSAPPKVAADEEPTGPSLEDVIDGEPLARVEFAQGQSDGPVVTPIVEAVCQTAGVEVADLHDAKKTHPSLRAKIEDVASAIFRLAARWRNKGGRSLLVVGKNKEGKIVASCEHEKGARSSVLVLDVPAASPAAPAAAAPKTGATGASASADLAPPAFGVPPPAPPPRRPAGSVRR